MSAADRAVRWSTALDVLGVMRYQWTARLAAGRDADQLHHTNETAAAAVVPALRAF